MYVYWISILFCKGVLVGWWPCVQKPRFRNQEPDQKPRSETKTRNQDQKLTKTESWFLILVSDFGFAILVHDLGFMILVTDPGLWFLILASLVSDRGFPILVPDPGLRFPPILTVHPTHPPHSTPSHPSHTKTLPTHPPSTTAPDPIPGGGGGGRTDGRTAIHAPQMHAPQTLIHSPQPSDALNHLPNPNPKKVYARAPAKAILWVGGHYIGRTRTSARTDGGGGGRRRRRRTGGRTDGRTAIHAPQMHAPQTPIHSPQPSDALNHLPNPDPKKVYARAPPKLSYGWGVITSGGRGPRRGRTAAAAADGRTDGQPSTRPRCTRPKP